MKKIFASLIAASMMLVAFNANAQISAGLGYINAKNTSVYTSDNTKTTTETPLNGFYVGGQYDMPIPAVSGLGVNAGVYANFLFGSKHYDGLFGLGGSFSAVELIAQAVGSLTQPILQGGQLTAQLRNAKANQEKASLQFVQTLYDAGNEVYRHKKAIETAEEKSGHIDIRVNALQEAFSATTELMNHGSNTYLEVLTAQESLLSAQLSQVQNQYEMIQALINLYTALGGFGK